MFTCFFGGGIWQTIVVLFLLGFRDSWRCFDQRVSWDWDPWSQAPAVQRKHPLQKNMFTNIIPTNPHNFHRYQSPQHGLGSPLSLMTNPVNEVEAWLYSVWKPCRLLYAFFWRQYWLQVLTISKRRRTIFGGPFVFLLWEMFIFSSSVVFAVFLVLFFCAVLLLCFLAVLYLCFCASQFFCFFLCCCLECCKHPAKWAV